MIIENDPRKKYKKITVIVLVAVLLGWIVYQQITLNAIRKIVMPTGNATNPNSVSVPGQALSDDVVAQRKNELIADTRDLTGTVTAVSGNTIKVEAEVVDLEKIKDATVDDVKTFAKTKKIFSVATNDKTEFLSKKLADIKGGDSIKVYADDALYTLDSITATRIVSPVVSDKDAATQGPKFVSGKAAKIENNAITLTAMSKDGKEAGTFTVKVGAGTKILKREFTNPPKDTGISLGDIKQGDGVTALAANPIGDRKEFDAMQVILTIAPPKK